ncbi:hypothetical protein MINTM002_31500 [Mycobacterium intracellulare]|nr:hypothetical protein MINTM002_31500 [Mycobacterium intracellulare]
MELAWRAPSFAPGEVVSLHSPRREGQSDVGIVKTLSKCLKCSREQPIITVQELDIVATRKFQTSVVVSIQAQAKIVAYQAVSGAEQCRGYCGPVVCRLVIDNNDLELDAILIQDAA